MLPKTIALLFASGDAISKKELASLLGLELQVFEDSVPSLRDAVKNIGLALIESNNDIQLVTGEEHADLVASLLKKDLEGELTPATLQVLTIIAYLGKVTRSDISFIRGVQSTQSIRTLTARGLISKTGEQCELTLEALRYLGVEKSEDLPEYESLHKDLEARLLEAKQEM